MAIQTFTAAQVLTAAQMNALQANDYNQTVSAKVASYTLVAADKGTRITMSNAAATTITVNTSLFAAGDSLRIQNIGAGACTITAGTATVTSAGPLALVQWAGGQLYFTSASAAVWFPDAVTATPGGLVALTSETTFTTATAITKDNIFSAAYTNYLILCNFTCTAAGSMRLQLRTGGVSAATNYNGQGGYFAISTAYASRSTAQTSAVFMEQGTIGMSFALQIYKPFIASQTQFASSNVSNETTAITPLTSFWSGNHTTATSYDGFTLTPNSTQTLTGTYSVYGYSI